MKTTISLFIDGNKIYVDEGTTILSAALQNDIHIPTLCYHPRLEPLGHCRLCLVEIEGFDGPVTSCDNPVTNGMIVTTDSPALREKRSRILELFLSTHPYKDCLTCVRTGRCELQDNAYQYQVELPEQLDRNRPGSNTGNPYIIRDDEKCILCGRCIQVCRTGPGASVYDMIGNGVNTRVVPVREGKEVSLEEAGCVFCGQCIDVCPVAALTEVGRSSGGREWELLNHSGICLGCSLGCYLERQSTGDNIVKVTIPREGDRVSWLCRKGKFGFIADPAVNELSGILKKDEENYSSAEYEEAVKEVAESLLTIKNNHGQDALALLASGDLSSEEGYLLQKLARTILETKNIDLGAEPGWVSAHMKVKAVTGQIAVGLTQDMIKKAGAILVVGSGLEESHPVAAMVIGQAGRFKDAVIIKTESGSDKASAWDEILLPNGKGGEKALFESITALVDKLELNKKSEKINRVDDVINRAAGLLNRPDSCIIVTPKFLEIADEAAIESLVLLAQACGVIEKGRSRMLLLSKYSNAAGLLTAGATPYSGPGFAELNGAPGKTRLETEAALKEGKIKGVLLFGNSFGHLKRGKVEFVAVVCSNRDEAPHGADMIIPAQQIIYKEGLFTNAAGQTRLNEGIADTGKCLPQDWRLICDLARAMGKKWSYASLEDVREEMKGLISAF